MPRKKSIIKDKNYYRAYRKRLRLAVNIPTEFNSGQDVNESGSSSSSSSNGYSNSHNNIFYDINNTFNEQIADDIISDNSVVNGEESTQESDNDNESLLTSATCLSDDLSSTHDVRNLPSFNDKVAEWLIEANGMGLTREHANKLFRLLKETGGQDDLPADSRTLTKRPRNINVDQGESVYSGIEDSLRNIHTDNLTSEMLQLKIGIDGVPIHKDGKKMQLWPILIATEEIPPLVVALWYGETKPSSIHDFLHKFLEELQRPRNTGLIIKQRQFFVSIKCFICDAPARAFVKQIKYHNGRQSCERCQIVGCDINNTMCYINRSNKKRTDEGYKNGEYKPDHQKIASPLINYDIGLVTKFPLDYMHLICLGVVRRFLKSLTKASTEYRISHNQFNTIGARLAGYSHLMPSEFSRPPRSLKYIDRYKATEFRQFLLYTGIFALKSIVSVDVYHTFLCLSIALAILLNDDNENRRQYLYYARQLLDHFVSNSEKIFGRPFITYNVHNLLHITDDCKMFDCALGELSAFQFESYLYKIKRRVKHSNNTLVQLAKSIKMEPQLKKTQTNFRTHRLNLSTNLKDRHFLSKSQQLCVIKQIVNNGTEFICDLIDSNCLEAFFELPCNSTFMLIYYCQNLRSLREVSITKEQVWRKVVLLPVEKGGHIIIPLIHEGLCS